jgi:cobalt-zinc-cadmium resistance protein CzcA
VQVNREIVARYGLEIADVNGMVDNAFGGSVATQVLEGERNFDLAVKLRPELIENLDSIRAIPLFGSNNEVITLGQVADVGIHSGFARIYRDQNERRVAAKFSVRNRDLGSVVAEAQGKVDAQVKLPPGYRLEWTGSFENEQRATRRLMVVVPITLAAIFFILFAAFNSARSAFLVLINVPLAAFGGVVGLAFAGLPLSVSAMAGFVALFGIAIEYCVIMITRIHELEAEGMAVYPAIREGALSRLRAVLMTSIMAALGLLPAAISHAVGSETARPFATVIVGGLVSSTLLTLFVFPAVCTFFLRDHKPPDGNANLSPAPEEPALA